MFPKVNPVHTSSWNDLLQHSREMENVHMRQLFDADKNRFSAYSIIWEDLLFDFSKNRITDETLRLLFQLYTDCKVTQATEAMFNGELINETENRSVLHTALRNFSAQPVYSEGVDVMPEVRNTLKQIEDFCNRLHAGEMKGFSGKPIRYVVNIGIGGSDLGPVMVTEALKPYSHKNIKSYFVSNIDGSHIAEVFSQIKADETLFIIASKTFTTIETMTNAHTAREWFLKNGGTVQTIQNHFVAVSVNEAAVAEFGIADQNRFVFWDWVGGRYSVWSAIGLSVAATIGYDHFEQFLKGAYAADNHFRNTPPQRNIPVLMALIGIWNRNFLGASAEAILPYDQYLHRFPAYFQQANMESNGKSVDRNGYACTHQTGPLIWGEPGTNGQHAFFQWLHQGTSIIPCDFIAPAQSHNPIGNHHDQLLSNFFAQTEALMMGADNADPHKHFPGNRPTNTFLLKKITPYSLGSLIALYEHKIFVQGVIWNIYSFDQFGVELGKVLAKNILKNIEAGKDTNAHDASTNGLINAYLKMKA